MMSQYVKAVYRMSTIDDNITNRSKSLEIMKSKFLELLSQMLPSQSLKTRGPVWLGRYERDNTPATIAQFYADSLFHPVPFGKIITLIPEDAILVQIAIQNGFHTIIAKSLESTVISLCKREQKHTIQSFLEGIGDLYNIGFQPQIANLYPPVQFPVSRGTPMISPLVRWDHTDDYYVYQYRGQHIISSRERLVSITTTDGEFEYFSGHVIDGKNLLPATGYLFLIWHMIGLLSGIDYRNIPIVFENVKFVRATNVSKRENLNLLLIIQEGSNNFEIIEGDNVIVSGFARVPNDIACEKLPVQFLSNSDEDNEYMKTADIYKELRLRGYQYTGLFRLLKSASITGKVGHIRWPINWAAFMDNMLQMKILTFDSRNICVPTEIRKLIIDPEYHMKQLHNISDQDKSKSELSSNIFVNSCRYIR
ncbi:PREDICTED: fatty acid synthase-like [Dinoponera quadriceps]|uniref:Fatty acid synthase-like n=1 Tax=Dinoponera quadriceps TaxID=609295 RepID=A0A6P3XG71_DINQU|nr:PREDICTED: fatty acid synthase-like [Dinoponera quadriceps]